MSSLKEGNLYKVLTVEGKTFEIRYGYYSDSEREIWEPTPLFPNFEKNPMYTDCGHSFVTAEQDVCEHFSPKPKISGENWCADCIYYGHGEEIIGVCKCDERKSIFRQNE